MIGAITGVVVAIVVVAGAVVEGRRRARRDDKPEPCEGPVAEQPESVRDVAHEQDHGHRPPRRPKAGEPGVAEGLDPVRDDGGGQRVCVGRRIDGGTAWRWGPPVGKAWPCWGHLVEAAKAGRRVVEWPDHRGELVTLTLERGKPGSGKILLRTGRLRLEIWRRRAETQITAEAAEVEGVASWYLREMARVAYWLFGVGLEAEGAKALADQLVDYQVRQHRIEQCCDLAGVVLELGANDLFVSKCDVWSWKHRPGRLDGYGAGKRESTKNSIAVYDKPGKMARERGPERAALTGRMLEAGWDGEEAWTRIDHRAWGDALLLEGEGIEIDATHPGAALDEELLGLIWTDGLSRHWQAAPRAKYFERLREWISAGRPKNKEPRLRDEPKAEWWELARAQGSQAEPLRLRRDLAARQLSTTREHARERLGQAAADVEVLEVGTGDGGKALGAVNSIIEDSAKWTEYTGRARARHEVLLEQGEA